MKKVGALLTLLLPLITSCDSLHYGYIKNESDNRVEVTLSFIDFQARESDKGIKNYVKYRMEDSVIASSAKLTHLNNNTSRLSFSLCSGCQVELLFDTAPIQYEYIELDTLRIETGKVRKYTLQKKRYSKPLFLQRIKGRGS
ncbi:hypothetical protein [Pontibacter indicus]|uniref:hypothetical protein n=1 Tax=Pontibacter indicus TaxID=1317125 RepID=UPI000976A5A4|nr:hypothetical protein [Pontibacter indicus]